jgi:hypothetical protein
MLISFGLALWRAVQALVLTQALSEGRAVANMSENVGRWAS